MSISLYLTQPVTVQPMAGNVTDDYGNTQQGADGAPVDEFGYLDQKDTIQYLNDRDTVVSKFKAFLAADTVAAPLALVTFGSQVFRVDGEPYHVFNPRTRVVSHVECSLVIVQ